MVSSLPGSSMPDDPAYGAMSDVMKDHLYILERGHLFTTPCIGARLSLRFYTTIAVSANGSPIKFDSGSRHDLTSAAVFRASQDRIVRGRDVQLVAALVNPLHPEFPRFRRIPAPGIDTLELERFTHLADDLGRAYRGELDLVGAMHLHEKITAAAAAAMPPMGELDPRAVVAAARARVDPDVSITKLATELDLSPSRLSHLFTSEMGLPLRAYLLWAKVHRTATLLAQGIKLTEITHLAGFADQAHMRRVFHDLFGAPPSHFLRNENVVVQLGRV